MDTFDFINWYIERYGLRFQNHAENAWRALAHRLARVEAAPGYPSGLRLYAYRKRNLPRFFCADHGEAGFQDVDEAGLDARSSAYDMDMVTGIDFPLQAELVTQLSTVSVITTAWNRIRHQNLHNYAFVCNHATHRSVACCMLLAAIAFPHAEICLTTPRTQAAARSRNLM